MLRPEDDGVTHINIYSKAKTELGKWLSNFAYSPVTLREGHFKSLEGYWYFLLTRDDRFRDLVGYKAKQLGKTLVKVEVIDEEAVKTAMEVKLRSNPEMLELFKQSTLPFTHYYVFDGRIKPAGYDWIVKHWEKLRRDAIAK